MRDSDRGSHAETINGLYKAEVIHRSGPWRSFEAVEFATPVEQSPVVEADQQHPAGETDQHYYVMPKEPAKAA